jgi:hypothetical protein
MYSTYKFGRMINLELPKNTHAGVMSRSHVTTNKFNPGNRDTFSPGQLRDMAKANRSVRR